MELDLEQENSIMLYINERLFSQGIITQMLYDYAKEMILKRT